MDYNFKVDTKRLTLGDLIALENQKMSEMVKILARCLTNEKGEYYEFDAAHEIILAIPLDEFKGVADQFGESMKVIKEGAIPPTGGGK